MPSSSSSWPRNGACPKRGLTLTAGAADRRKSILLAGDPVLLQPRLEAWLARALQAKSQR
ncbi:MAG: hypothetical protein K0S81_3150 [Rhodospirillales bacterium]|jgi:hypothetical protein|nr:hypothetical protein [Rhodospirillales bacterium]